ncbi:MAG: MoaD/ThiS family protein [Polyangiaceae bacterium]
MAANVRIPTPLRSHTDGQDVVSADGNTIAEVLDDLDKNYPGIKAKLVDDKGVRRFVNIYIGDEDIRFMDKIETAVKDGDEISIVPAIAGG